MAFGAGGGSDSISVTTANNCSWSATSDRGWVSIPSGASGTGNGSVQISVAPNTGEAPRNGTLTIAGISVAVTEEGVPPCAVSISPDRASFTKDSAEGTFAVNAAGHCQWSATSQASWIAVRSGSPGTGNGTVTFAVDQNRDTTSRTGPITVADRTFTVTQAGDTLPLCTYSLSTSSLAFGAGGGSQSVGVSTPAHCSWGSSSDVPWISITTAPSLSGNGSVTLSVTPNPGESERTGTARIAELVVTVRQAGTGPLPPCSIDISPDHGQYAKEAATGSFAVTAPAHCAWTATSSASWLTVTSGGQGSGSGTVGYAVSANTAQATRTTTITVANRTFTVNQTGDSGSCEYSVQPVDLSACMVAPTLSVSVTTSPGCTWTAATSDSWITLLTGQSGVGSGVITFSLSDNFVEPRQGIVMVRWPTITAGQNVRVAQAGCRYGVSTTNIAMTADGGTGRFDVLQQSDPTECGGALQDRCVWTAVADVPWIKIATAMPQRGDNPVSFDVAPNNGPARTGTITVRDKVVHITQAAR